MPENRAPHSGASRWELIRDIAVFQLKVGVDALRDLALVPVSLVAGAVDLIRGGERPGKLFYDVLDAGRRTENWINLFGDLDGRRFGQTTGEPDEPLIDSVAARLENLIVEQIKNFVDSPTVNGNNALAAALLVELRKFPRNLPWEGWNYLLVALGHVAENPADSAPTDDKITE